MGIFGNEEMDSIFGDIFGASFTNSQATRLDNYWRTGEAQKYYQLLNELKSYGKRIFRNEKTGKHIVK